MKRLSMLASIVLLLTFTTGTVMAQSEGGYDLYQKALVKERAVGDVQEALRLYQRIVREFGSNHALAAKAQYRMALLYDRLGRKAEAQRNYQSVVSNYSDQSAIARQAQARIVKASTVKNDKGRMKPVAEESEKGMTVRKIGEEFTIDSFGAPSPDGKYLAGTDWSKGSLFRYDLTTGERRYLTNNSYDKDPEEVENPKVSPDGKTIAYVWWNKENFGELRTISADGGEPRVLYRNPEVIIDHSPYQWSADGKEILVQAVRKDGTKQIALVSTRTGALRVIKTLDWRQPTNASLSPDGRYIVYDFPVDEKDSNRDIFLLAADGSRETPLITHPANDISPIWSPDGNYVVFCSDRSGSMGLWVIRVKDGKAEGSPQLVKANTGNIWPRGFTNNGTLYYGTEVGNQNIFQARLNLETGQLIDPPRQVVQHFVGENFYPTLTRDGKYLAYLSRRGSAGEVTPVIREVDTGAERELPLTITLPKYTNPLPWSPDGTALLATGQEKGQYRLFKIDVRTGNATPIVTAELGQRIGGRWLPDGKRIIYGVRDENTTTRRHVIRDLSTGKEQELFRSSGIGGSALSRDGKQLAFVWMNDPKSKEFVIKSLSTTDGTVRELLKVQSPVNLLTYTPDGRFLLFLLYAQMTNPFPVTEVWMVPAEGGEPRKTGLTGNGIGALSFFPDGERIVFQAGTGGRGKSELWAIKNFLPTAQKGKSSMAKR